MFVGVSIAAASAEAGMVTITGGSATFTLLEQKAASIYEFDAYFDASATRTQTLSGAAPGNAAFTETTTNPGVVTLTDPIRPFGVVPSPTPGTPGVTRSPQQTTLQFDTTNVLGTWGTSNDNFAFVGNSTLGEQIAFSNMTRWTGPFTGVLVYGDFGLRYTGSKLVLTSNIDFLNAAFADIGSPSISVAGNKLLISGDLLYGGGLYVLDPSAAPGTKFGTFSMEADFRSPEPVPEPSSIALLASAGIGMIVPAAKRLRRKSGASPDA